MEQGRGQTLHHIGFVVASIAESAERLTRWIQGSWDGRVFHDPVQTVQVTFLQPRQPQEPLLELVEPDGEQSRVVAFLKRGGGLHHLCYEVDHLETQLRQSRAAGGLIVLSPAPAVAFGGRQIAWVYTREKLLLEYLER
jgi:methylmalonyl-CoA/ethylmalonyl-CoA epimerase